LSTLGESLSGSEKAEALADSLQTQFQPVTDTLVPALIEMVDVVLRSYFLTPTSKPDKVHGAIRGLKVSKVPSQNGIPNRAFKNFPQRAVSLLPPLQCSSPHPSLCGSTLE